MLIDFVVYGLVDNAYNLIFSIASVTLNNDVVEQIIKNLYIVVGIFAFFRIALLLVNAIIDPEKLNEKGKGLPNILLRTIMMLVILVFLPTLFNLAYEFQADVLGIEKVMDEDGKIVEVKYKKSGNLIEKLILGESISGTQENSNFTPGDNFKSIALSALITVDEKFVTDDGLQVPTKDNDWKGGYKAGENCTTNLCNRAINDWNEMYVKGNMNIATLRNYILVNEKVENKTTDQKETVYVYNYSVVITTIVGGLIVWILLSFALDIGMRVFQLAALEIIAPVFVATFVDPQSASSGMFNRWLKEVGSTYANLFIRIACVSLMVLFASLLNQIEFFSIGKNSTWVKLALLLGLMIFAKKAPKWISDLLGLKSEGLGLSIRKKIAEGALGGALMAKGAKGLAGAALATGKNLRNQRRHRKEQLKDAKAENPHLLDNTKEGKAYRAQRNKENYRNIRAQNKGMGAKDALELARRQTEKDIRDEKKKAGLNKGTGAAQIASAAINGIGAFSAAAKADNLSGALKVSSDRSKAFKDQKALQGDSRFDKLKTAVTRQGVKLTDAAWGDEGQIYERADKLSKQKARKLNHTKEAFDKYGDALYDGMGAFSKVIQADKGIIAKNIEDAKAIYGAKLSGVDISNIQYENGTLKIDGKTDVSEFVNTAQDSLSGHGKVDFLDKFNKTQNTSVTEYQDNLKQQQSIAQSIAPLQQMLNDTFKNIKDSFKNIKIDPSLDAKLEINDNGSIKIDGKDLNFSDISLDEWANKPEGSEERMLYEMFNYTSDSGEEIGQRMLNFMQQAESYDSTIKSQQQQIISLGARNDQYKLNIQGIQDKVNIETGLLDREENGTIKKDPRAVTLSGALNVIALDRDTIDKKLAAADKQAEKEGDA